MAAFSLTRAGFAKYARVLSAVSSNGDGPEEDQEVVVGGSGFRVTKVTAEKVLMEPNPDTFVARELVRHPERFEYRGIDQYAFSL